MSMIGQKIAEANSRFEAEIVKFNAGNKSAGVRARKALMEIKQIASDGRKLISASKPQAAQEPQAAPAPLASAGGQ